MARPTDKLEWIKSDLATGRTVYVSTSLRALKITPKYLASINSVVKATAKSLYISRGKSWDCADYCQLTAQ